MYLPESRDCKRNLRFANSYDVTYYSTRVSIGANYYEILAAIMIQQHHLAVVKASSYMRLRYSFLIYEKNCWHSFFYDEFIDFHPKVATMGLLGITQHLITGSQFSD